MERLNKILLFLLPIFLAIPNVAIDFSIINLRIDDSIVYLLVLIHFRKIFNFNPHFFIQTQYFMLFYAAISLLIALSLTFHRVSGYEVTRAVGSIPHLVILPIILSNQQYRHFIYKGALLGGVIYLGSIIYNYNSILLEAKNMERASSFKSEIGFNTLNPNAVATIGLILGWLNVLGYFETKNRYFLISLFLLLIPFFTLARASSIGTLVAVSLLVLLSRGSIKKYLLYATMLLSGWFVVTTFINQDLLTSATSVNIETGEGLSKRDVLWKQGVQLVEESPFFGHGFSTENGLYIDKFDGHMAHQILLHYAIELGIFILFIFVTSVFFLLRNRLFYYKTSGNMLYLIQLCLFLGFFITDMAGQLLYFNKYAYIIYGIATFTPNKVRNEY